MPYACLLSNKIRNILYIHYTISNYCNNEIIILNHKLLPEYKYNVVA